MPDPLRIHLYATDVSALDLVKGIDGDVTALVIPENRTTSEKVQRLLQETPLPVVVQKRGQAPDAPAADAAIVWMYSQIFPPELLKSYPRGMFNMHGGRIPDYRGASVLQWAIIQGETELGVTWHQIVDEVDAGPIWGESSIKLGPRDTAWDARCAIIREGSRIFPKIWKRILKGDAPLRQPDLSSGKVWLQRKASDGRFGPGQPERRVRNLIRALCSPWPPAIYVNNEGGEFSIAGIVEQATDGSIDYPTAEGKVIHLVTGAS